MQPGVDIPPSLINIYKELQSDLDIAPASHGCLSAWAEQGVLLLNAVLTVERSRAASHQGKGWEQFTDKVVHVLNDKCEGLVFLLWGSYAQKKGHFIDRQRHLVLAIAASFTIISTPRLSGEQTLFAGQHISAGAW